MGIGTEGQNLIFLVSQPRAGSTMTQRVLGNHPDVHTVSEPWILLPSLYPLRFDNSEIDYNRKLFKIAWKSFFQQLPEQEDAYYDGLRVMYSYIYDRALETAGKKYFLDKTPRYYYIIPEICRAFPKAQFIILLRNPLAVICSIMTTWVKTEFSKLDRSKNDLTKAPGLLLEGIKQLGDRCLVLRYEKIIVNPEREFKKICMTMGLEFVPAMIEYGAQNSAKWRFGDQKLVYNKTRPDPENLDKWISSLQNPHIWQAANDYLQFLGHELVYRMGYSYRELRKILDDHQPKEVDWTGIPNVEWFQKKYRQHQKAPQTSLGYVIIAKEQKQNKQLTKSIASYKKAIELNPNSAWSHYNLGQALAKNGNFNEAAIAYEKAIQLKPDSSSFRYSLGEVLVEMGKLGQGAFQYNQAIKIKPNFSSCYNKLGEVLIQQGKLSEAITHFQKAIEFNPNLCWPYGNMAAVMAVEEKKEDAINYYQNAIKLNPNYKASHPELIKLIK